MNLKQCIIMRGASGSGKSTVAKELAQRIGACIVSADDHFLDASGVYRFDPKGLGRAHGKCFGAFKQAIRDGRHVIIDNTNARASDAQAYVDEALSSGYSLSIIEMITPVAISVARNVHGVDALSVSRQSDRMTTPIDHEQHVTWRIDGSKGLDDIRDWVDVIEQHLL